MSVTNPLWGAPRIHGELLKLGIDVGQTSVAKYMARRRCPLSQGWKTFLLNHANGIVSIDLFVVPTVSFRLLYGLVVLRHERRRLLHVGVTAHPCAEWIARQITEACGWEDTRPNISSVIATGGLWCGVHTPASCQGHSRQTNSAAIALAERPFRTADRLDQTGVPRSRRHPRRTAPARCAP